MNTIKSAIAISLLLTLSSLNSFADALNETNITEQPYSTLPVKQVINFAKAFDLIKNNYVEVIDDDTLLKYAIEGMVEKLDPHSSYFDTQSLQSFNESTSGKFTGLGLI